MKKQVLAIMLATLLILTTFAACGKKYLVYTDQDGVEHPVLTDAEGNTMVNEYGQIVIGVTDARGHLVTDENGENETRAVVFPSSISGKNVYETPNFKWEVPEKIWYFDGDKLLKKDSAVYADISIASDYETLAELEEGMDKQLDAMVSQANGQITSEKSKWVIEAGPNALQYNYEIKDQDGNLHEQRTDIFFATADGTIYRLLFVLPATEADSVSFADLVNMIKFR